MPWDLSQGGPTGLQTPGVNGDAMIGMNGNGMSQNPGMGFQPQAASQNPPQATNPWGSMTPYPQGPNGPPGDNGPLDNAWGLQQVAQNNMYMPTTTKSVQAPWMNGGGWRGDGKKPMTSEQMANQQRDLQRQGVGQQKWEEQHGAWDQNFAQQQALAQKQSQWFNRNFFIGNPQAQRASWENFMQAPYNPQQQAGMLGGRHVDSAGWGSLTGGIGNWATQGAQAGLQMAPKFTGNFTPSGYSRPVIPNPLGLPTFRGIPVTDEVRAQLAQGIIPTWPPTPAQAQSGGNLSAPTGLMSGMQGLGGTFTPRG